LDNNILNKISSPVRSGSVSGLQGYALDLVINDRVLTSLLKMEDRFGKENVYTLPEYMNDLKAAIWSELKTGKTVDIFSRAVQKNYISNVFASIKETEEGKNLMGMMLGISETNLPITLNSDLGSFLRLHIENLRTEILKAVPLTTDKETKEHLSFLAKQIRSGLDKQFELATKGIE
jgi:hypothetical protein